MKTRNAGTRKTQAARFDALPAASQMALARHIVDTRAGELKLAHDDLLLVTAGYRSQRDAQGRAMFHPQPCVIFGVARKWSGKGRTDEPEAKRLPRFLPVHGTRRGRQHVYQVPTDVQPAGWFYGAVARTTSSVWAHEPENHGTLACAVRVRTPEGTKSFGLSAMHVLSPWAQMDRAVPDAGEDVYPTGAATAVGASTRWGGGLRENAPSFDVQLAAIGDAAWFSAAFSGWSLPAGRPHVRTRKEFDTLAATQSLMVLAPANHPVHPDRGPMMAQFRSYAGSGVPIEYKVRVNGVRTRMHVRHRELVQLEVTANSPAPAKGDSGSAVVTWRLDGSLALAGMFIASVDGAADRVAYMLPAWELFDLSNWASLPPGTTRMTPRFSFP